MKPSVFLTRALPGPVMVALKNRFRLKYNRRDRPLRKSELIRGMRGCEGLITMLSDTIDREVLARNPGLKVIANYAVGSNNIDLGAATRRGIVVTNTPGVLTEATADLTWLLILSLCRRILEGDRLVRKRKWSGWSPTQLPGIELYGKVLGIVGMGRIGKAVAKRAIGFGMRVVYYNRRRLSPPWEHRLHLSYRSFFRTLETADILSLHVPLTAETRHLIDRRTLKRMKPSSLLINASRGPVVDEKALVAALRSRKIAGAGLDVYENEPRIEKGLLSLPNVVLLPHLGSATVESRIRMGHMVIENVRAVLSGRPAPHAIKFE